MTAQYTTQINIGENRNASRIYLQGKYLVNNGFIPGQHCVIEFSDNQITIRADQHGTRKISGKKSGTVGVIDLSGAQIDQSFGDQKSIRVEVSPQIIKITPARIASSMKKRVLAMVAVSLFSGGGLLDHAAAMAGFKPLAAIEHNEKFAEVYAENNPSTHLFNSSVEEVSHAEMAQYAPVGLLTMGIPCEPYSAVRRVASDGTTKREGSGWSDHHLADMFHWGLRAIDAFNPHTVVVENVVGFQKSAAHDIMRLVLTRMGYETIESRIINPHDYGSITGRRRTVLVATMNHSIRWPSQSKTTRTTRDFLLDPNDETLEWFDRDDPNKGWLFSHWANNDAKGNGFTPPVIYGDETHFPTIKKRYWAGQGDNFVIGHPTQPNTYRWLTVAEGKRIMGLPDSYQLGEAKTTAGEIIGQGVEVSTFAQIIASVTDTATAADQTGLRAPSTTTPEFELCEPRQLSFSI